MLFSRNEIKIQSYPGSGGTCLSSQHLGGRGRRISEFKANLFYRVNSRTARATQKTPVLKNKKQNNNNKPKPKPKRKRKPNQNKTKQNKTKKAARRWQHMPLIPKFRSQRQADLLSLRTTWYMQQISEQPRLHRETLSRRKKSITTTIIINKQF
jgi:hypothetical protein